MINIIVGQRLNIAKRWIKLDDGQDYSDYFSFSWMLNLRGNLGLHLYHLLVQLFLELHQTDRLLLKAFESRVPRHGQTPAAIFAATRHLLLHLIALRQKLVEILVKRLPMKVTFLHLDKQTRAGQTIYRLPKVRHEFLIDDIVLSMLTRRKIHRFWKYSCSQRVTASFP